MGGRDGVVIVGGRCYGQGRRSGVPIMLCEDTWTPGDLDTRESQQDWRNRYVRCALFISFVVNVESYQLGLFSS